MAAETEGETRRHNLTPADGPSGVAALPVGGECWRVSLTISDGFLCQLHGSLGLETESDRGGFGATATFTGTGFTEEPQVSFVVQPSFTFTGGWLAASVQDEPDNGGGRGNLFDK